MSPAPRRSAASSRARSTARPATTPQRRPKRSALKRAQRRRNVILGTGATIVILALVVLALNLSNPVRGYNITTSAWKLPRQGGGTPVSLASLSGKPTVVNFFASWCIVCADELPVFASDATALRGKVNVVEVNALETGNGPAFAAKYGLAQATTAVLDDVGGGQGDGLYTSLGGSGTLPMTAFYSPSGKLLGTHVGGYDSATLASAISTYYGISVPS